MLLGNKRVIAFMHFSHLLCANAVDNAIDFNTGKRFIENDSPKIRKIF
jgi:hypothetical protein